MKNIKIDHNTQNKINEHLENAYPNEGVGFLLGVDKEYREIQDVFTIENAKEGDQKRRFQVDPKDYMKAEAAADQKDLQLLGIFHSHPNHPAQPSEHDLKSAVPFFSYFITKVEEGKAQVTTSWQLNSQGAFEEETIIK